LLLPGKHHLLQQLITVKVYGSQKCVPQGNSSSLQPATQQYYFYSGLMINHYKNLTVRMQSGLVPSPEGLGSTSLDEKPPGSQDRTSEKQNDGMDWSRIPTFPLL